MKLAIQLLLSILLILINFSQISFSQTYLRADGLTYEAYDLINSVLGKNAAAQVPDCNHNVSHIWQDFDSFLNHSVFFFAAHLLYDNDRCVMFDRQRTEIGPDPGPLTPLFGDTVSYSWDFRLDENFQVSYMFTHVSQIKAKGGKDSMPMVTIQGLKTDEDVDLLMVIHMDGLALNSTTNATTLASVDLNEFRGEWIHARQQVTFGWEGAYDIKLTRLRDGKVLIDVDEPKIEMWRYDDGQDNLVQFAFPKWGIYRSLNYNEHLRDEVVRFDNFCLGINGEYCP